MSAAAGFLPAMVSRRRERVAADLATFTPDAAPALAAAGRPPRDLLAALRDRADVAVIAEFKRASPSAGDIALAADPAARAVLYAAGGAAAVSVLCEPESFGGSLDDLAAVSAATALPTLCKDFVVDERQLYAARAAGADAALLMVSVLGERIGGYLALARDLDMQALVEVHDAAELAIALDSGAALVGVNSRDLRDLTVDVAGALPLVRTAAGAGMTVVAESGIRRRADVAAAGAAGASAVLVGTLLMRSEDPARELAALTGVARRSGRSGRRR